MRRRTLLGALAVLPAAACTTEPDTTPSPSARPTATPTPTPTPTPTSTSAPGPSHSPTPSASPSTKRHPSTPPPARGSATVARTLATGLHSPWGLVFLPGGDAVLGSRDQATLTRIAPDGTTRSLGRVPGVAHGGEGGLLGLVLSPQFARDRQLFCYHTTESDNRVVRGRLGRRGLAEVTPVLTGIPHGTYHNGGGLCFGPDGNLYVSTGEGGEPARAQDKSSLGGKILRITPTGEPARDNPFGHSPVFSYGHRNVESIAFDGRQLWAVEFGDHTYDELNAIKAGANYGWPQTEGRTDAAGITSPAVQWPTESAGPAGIAIADSVAWIACLTGERMYRVVLHGRSANRPQAFFAGRYGRLRRSAFDPHGRLWLITSNTDGRGQVRSGDDRILVLNVR